MQGIYYDGSSSRPHAVRVAVSGSDLVGEGETASFRWPFREVRLIEARGGRVRLAPARGDGRLVLGQSDWESLSRTPVAEVRRRLGRRERRLVIGLTAAGVSLSLAIFVGVPLAARPLARVTPLEWEAKMGENLSAQIQLAFKPCQGDAAGREQLEALANRLARRADMPFPIRVVPVEAPMANAFALPGGAVLVTDDLIDEARHPDEIAGVLAHEIAHIEKRHVMESVWRSLGLGLVLDAVVGGGSGAGQQAVLLTGNLTQQRFSRELEDEADRRAFELLAGEGISTAGMADFFERMADRKTPEGVRNAAEWFSTHPESGRRALAARARARPGEPALGEGEWQAVRRACPTVDRRAWRPWPLRR